MFTELSLRYTQPIKRFAMFDEPSEASQASSPLRLSLAAPKIRWFILPNSDT